MRFVVVLIAAGCLSGVAVGETETTPEMTTSVVRINNKRFKKVTSGSQSLYVPSLGLPVASSLVDAVCPSSLGASDEVLEIGKPVPADEEYKAASKEILAAMQTCGKAGTKSANDSTVDCENDASVGMPAKPDDKGSGAISIGANASGGVGLGVKGAGVDCKKKVKK